MGQNDTGTGKSNHEPIWTRSYRGYSARRPSRDTARQKEGDETVAKWLISANIKLPWAYGYTTLPRCPLPIYQHFTEQPRRGRGKKKKKKKRADARRERYSVKGTDTADTERYDTSSKGRCLAHRHQPGPPFLPPPANRPLLRLLAWSTPHSHTP